MNKWQRLNYQPNLPLGKDGSRVTACPAHIDLSKESAKEGMVLVKNDSDLLPLNKGQKLALFGKATIDYVKGGGGSGDVTVSYTRNLYQGFKELSDQVEVYEPLADYYKGHVAKEYADGREPGLTVEPVVPDDLLRGAKAFADTAIISISRFSGEGWDRKSSSEQTEVFAEPWVVKTAQRSNELFEEGDFYLSQAEAAMVAKVKESFDQVVVVMNVGGMVDTEWFAQDPSIQSVLMAWQGGIEGGLAAAELICGLGCPSGKLVDSFAKSLLDYPSTEGFHDSRDYVAYEDDIYVGYRYFETIPEAGGKVNYPFGFGLSYTDFDWYLEDVHQVEDDVIFTVVVTNMGDMAGKEVVQVYGMPPQGALGKAQKNLLTFAKTRLLAPGESQVMPMAISVKDMASYDDLGKVQKSAYVLEAGTYSFFVGTSVRDGEVIEYSFDLEESRIVDQLSEQLTPTSLEKRLLANGLYETLPQKTAVDTDANALDVRPHHTLEGWSPESRYVDQHIRDAFSGHTLSEVAEGKLSLEDFMAQMSNEQLADILGGQPNTGVANTYGFGNISELGVPNVMTADGPAGVRIDRHCGVNTTAWPCSTLLASTWNSDLVEEIGEAGAKELKENNLGVWLTPAVNIHRSPLCGRNFEYYSEDPFLTGKMAAAMVRGIQSQGVAATAKHFVLNNKETNRKNSDSRVSERAAREIYLKGFEIIVKESDPWVIMSGYNIVNGQRASENRDLLENILRDEWGFDGVVTTDWWTYGEHYKEVKAGNDIKMGCGYPKRLLQAMEAGVLTREDMEVSARRVLELILKLD